jgi:hypothetical protein
MISTILAILTVCAADDDATPAHEPPPMRAVRVMTPPVIDGALDDKVWQRPRPYSHFVQRQPQEFGEPTDLTEVRFAYDDSHLYVGARLFDPDPKGIVGRLGRRDQITGSDSFWVYIDSFNDRRSAYYFATDAAGTKLDGTITNDTMDENNWDPSWNGVWDAAVRTDNDGWTVELAVPFSQLRYTSGSAPVFGVNLRRDRSSDDESDYVAFTPRKGTGFVSRFVLLEGLDSIPAPHQIEVLPYVTTKVELLPHSPGDPFNPGTRLVPNAGADLKIGFSSNLTLDVAANPDFGQAEVDPAVVNLSDIETHLEEKRPFFIEGAGTFKFGNGGSGGGVNLNWDNPQLFYSRRIGRKPQGDLPTSDYSTTPEATRILGAAKLSGKVLGNVAIGTLHAVTNREMGETEIAGVRRTLEVEPYTYYGVLRGLYERDEGRQGIGAIATVVARDLRSRERRDELSRDAVALGLDGWVFLDEKREWVLMAWGAGSFVNGTHTALSDLQQNPQHYLQRPDYGFVHFDPERTSLTGGAARLRLEKTGGNARFYSAIGAVDPRFEINAMGYLAQTDLINAHAGGGYEWLNPTDFIRDLLLLGVGAVNLNFDRRTTWDGVFSLTDVQFTSFDFVEVVLGFVPNQTINTRRTRGGPMTTNPAHAYHAEAYFQSDPRRSWVTTGDVYADGSPSSSTYHGNVSLEIRPMSSLSVSAGPTLERSRSQTGWIGAFDDPEATATYGSRYVFADLALTTVSMDLRLNWTFAPTLSLQLFAQPFVSVGRYRHFKELARPRSLAFSEYGRAQGTVSRGDGQILVDPTGSASGATFSFDDPDFSVKSLRGNAVLRWEYLPGSVLYVVWTQLRARDDDGEPLTLGRALRGVANERAENIFMVKLSYWWDV